MKTKTPKLVLTLALLAMLATARGDQIFVNSDNGFAGIGSVGEYNLDGTVVNTQLIPYGDLYLPQQMAVSGTNLFIAEAGENSIDEYTTSGTLVQSSLITGLNGPSYIVVSGTNLFVANTGSGTIAEYTTSGAAVNASLVSGLNSPVGLAVSGGNLFVANAGSGTIGEYTTSGAIVNTNLITGLNTPEGLAVSGSYLFVQTAAGTANGTIGEYTTSGAIVNTNLITGLGNQTGGSMVVDGSELFINYRGDSYGNGSVYEFTLGTTPGTVTSTNTSFITGLYEPTGIAVAFSVPPLGIGTLGNQSVVFWPVSSANVVLQTTTNLVSPNWVTASNGTPFNAVGFTNSSPAQFFRLQQQ
jgi:hypothetical protein